MKKLILFALFISTASQAALIVVPPAQDTSTAGKEATAAGQLRSLATQTFAGLLRSEQNTFNAIWKNPTLTAAQVYAGLGTDAASLRALMASIATSINALVPNTVNLVEPCPTVSNQDGTVTVTCPK